MWKKTIVAAGLLFLAGACGDGPETMGPAASGGSPLNAAAVGQADDIQELLAAHEAAWAAKDAAAYAATYTEDAQLINPVGGILVGSETIRVQHAFLFHPVTGFFRESTSTWTLRNLTFLTGTTALVEFDVLLTGISFIPPGLPQYAPGTVRTRVTWIAVKEGGEWAIAFQQMTPLPPPV